MKIIHRGLSREVVLCSNCKKPNNFYYLSDFEYGKWLAFLDEGKYAVINLLEDQVFEEYRALVDEILQKYKMELSKDTLSDIKYQIFGLTCDPIGKYQVDFTKKKIKCYNCGSTKFDKGLVQPLDVVKMDVALITHDNWSTLARDDKMKILEKALKDKKIL